VAHGYVYEGNAVNDMLVSATGARTLDEEASAHWGLNQYALVEAAGRSCAQVFPRSWTVRNQHLNPCVVLAGKGNNAADALVMIKALILDGSVYASDCTVFFIPIEPSADSPAVDHRTPLSEALLAVRSMGVTVTAWKAETVAPVLAKAAVIIDGIAGTGLIGPLRGTALEMATAANACGSRVVSVDMPSGNFDGWQTGMPMVTANVTLAIEPQKRCLYTPAARPCAGTILPVRGIFPPALISRHGEAALVKWESTAAMIPPVPPTAYKYERGLVEIRAGSPGSAGAAYLAARGAQSAGAGLVRLIVDPSLYPIIAPGCSGIMVVPDNGDTRENGRFSPHAVLLGPGWGRGEDRMRLLESCLPLEAQGVPLVLDADAIALAKDIVFNGNALITPHAGEFSAFTGIPKDAILNDPLPILRHCAAEKKVHILFKSHVLYAVSPDGRADIIDGMNPALAAGGSGDILAGFCAAIAARNGIARAAGTAAALLVRSAESDGIAGTFIDPADLADAAAAIAGTAWLPVKEASHE
jgi:NAD(P)H-hydrate epimerase